MANRVERRADRMTHMMRGAAAGALAAVAARVLGAVTMLMMNVTQISSFDGPSDTFRVVLAGALVPTIALVILGAVVGAIVAAIEPEAGAGGKK